MLIIGQRRSSQIATCLVAVVHFHLNEAQEIATINHQVRTIGEQCGAFYAKANVGAFDRALLWGRRFLNPCAFYSLESATTGLVDKAAAYRAAR